MDFWRSNLGKFDVFSIHGDFFRSTSTEKQRYEKSEMDAVLSADCGEEISFRCKIQHTTLRNWLEVISLPFNVFLDSWNSLEIFLLPFFNLTFAIGFCNLTVFLAQLFRETNFLNETFENGKVHFGFFSYDCVQVFPHEISTAQFLESKLDFFSMLNSPFSTIFTLKYFFTLQISDINVVATI